MIVNHWQALKQSIRELIGQCKLQTNFVTDCMISVSLSYSQIRKLQDGTSTLDLSAIVSQIDAVGQSLPNTQCETGQRVCILCFYFVPYNIAIN